MLANGAADFRPVVPVLQSHAGSQPVAVKLQKLVNPASRGLGAHLALIEYLIDIQQQFDAVVHLGYTLQVAG